jgi:N-dimethylarginine dimethylaminohydrolase
LGKEQPVSCFKMMPAVGTAGADVGRLTRVVVKHARDAFVSAEQIEREWRELNFTAQPAFDAAVDEYNSFLAVLAGTGAEILSLPENGTTTLDSIYVRDASLVTPHGLVLGRMGKPQRSSEPAAQRGAYEGWGIPIAGEIRPPGQIEGGDVVWLDERTVAVGRGYRTNDDGIRQFREILGSEIELIVVPLPHWRGPGDVFHLMSIISPVDDDLSVVYSPLMPVPFRDMLIARSVNFVEVPDEEFDSMGANVLALGPRKCLMVAGNPVTRERLERAGATVQTYAGTEISLKGGGGPTCLTRPLTRSEVKGQG